MFNLTNDLDEYTSDKGNRLICKDHTSEVFTETIVRALVLTPDQQKEMQEAGGH